MLARSAAAPIEHAPQIIQSSANAPLSAAFSVDASTLEPISQSELLRQMEISFGTANHAVFSVPVPSVCSTIPFAV